MKFINSVSGSVVIRATEDDIIPEKGMGQGDIINCVTGLYNFASRPTVPQGTHLIFPILAFGDGKLSKDDYTIPIPQLAMIANADVVTAQNTDLAEEVARHFMNKMDELLGFRYSTAPKQLTYLSNIVVEFENVTDSAAFTMIYNILETYLGKPRSLKRLFFGEGDVQQQQALSSLESIDKLDFIIERRAGAPYEANRFFCSAPLSTDEHKRALSEIDAAFASS
jgi:hypothetical protein